MKLNFGRKKDFMNKVTAKNINLKKVEKEIQLEIDNAFKFARKSKFPTKDNLDKFIYSK